MQTQKESALAVRARNGCPEIVKTKNKRGGDMTAEYFIKTSYVGPYQERWGGRQKREI